MLHTPCSTFMHASLRICMLHFCAWLCMLLVSFSCFLLHASYSTFVHVSLLCIDLHASLSCMDLHASRFPISIFTKILESFFITKILESFITFWFGDECAFKILEEKWKPNILSEWIFSRYVDWFEKVLIYWKIWRTYVLLMLFLKIWKRTYFILFQNFLDTFVIIKKF